MSTLKVVICRLGPNQTPLFHWKALDGSRALTWYSTHSYVWGWRLLLHESVEAAREQGLEEQAREILSQTPTPIFVHWGMDLILPTEKLVEFCVGHAQPVEISEIIQVHFERPIRFQIDQPGRRHLR